MGPTCVCSLWWNCVQLLCHSPPAAPSPFIQMKSLSIHVSLGNADFEVEWVSYPCFNKFPWITRVATDIRFHIYSEECISSNCKTDNTAVHLHMWSVTGLTVQRGFLNQSVLDFVKQQNSCQSCTCLPQISSTARSYPHFLLFIPKTVKVTQPTITAGCKIVEKIIK